MNGGTFAVAALISVLLAGRLPFNTLEKFNSATLHGTGVGKDVTYSEWTFDMTAKDGEHIVWNEVIAHRWRDGKIIGERYYQA